MARVGFDFLMGSRACPYLFDLEMSKNLHESLGFMLFMVEAQSIVLAGSGTRFPN